MRVRVALSVILLAVAWSAAQDKSSTIDATIHLTGAATLSPAERRQIVKEVERETRNSTYTGNLDEIRERLRMALQHRGYFTAQLGEPKISVSNSRARPQAVNVTIDVRLGNLYRLKDVTFTHSDVFPVDVLRRQFPLVNGDIFDTDKVRIGLEQLRKLYGASGFVNFTPVPEPQINEDAHSILLRIDLDEGALFHFGSLTVQGEESVPGARDRLLTAWKRYEGSIFTGQIPPGFLRDVGFAQGVDPLKVFRISLDEQRATANVFITLARLPD
jgi:outer membrane protein assembly factor BamA